MTPIEQAFVSGYIEGIVASMGKVRAYHVSDEAKEKKREEMRRNAQKILDKFDLTTP